MKIEHIHLSDDEKQALREAFTPLTDGSKIIDLTRDGKGNPKNPGTFDQLQAYSAKAIQESLTNAHFALLTQVHEGTIDGVIIHGEPEREDLTTTMIANDFQHDGELIGRLMGIGYARIMGNANLNDMNDPGPVRAAYLRDKPSGTVETQRLHMDRHNNRVNDFSSLSSIFRGGKGDKIIKTAITDMDEVAAQLPDREATLEALKKPVFHIQTDSTDPENTSLITEQNGRLLLDPVYFNAKSGAELAFTPAGDGTEDRQIKQALDTLRQTMDGFVRDGHYNMALSLESGDRVLFNNKALLHCRVIEDKEGNVVEEWMPGQDDAPDRWTEAFSGRRSDMPTTALAPNRDEAIALMHPERGRGQGNPLLPGGKTATPGYFTEIVENSGFTLQR